jgi:N-acetyl-alpha-D-muramate 1-phosphate uridylyltransferase
MKALIFAAGLGTRLAPLTDNTPKALVKVAGKPMLQMLIEKLKNQNINEFVINIHHFGEQIIEFLKANNNFNCQIEISDERDKLLDTGGGLKKAEKFLKEEPYFLVHNADIYSELSIAEMETGHRVSDALATLAVKNRKSSRKLGFNKNKQLSAWKNNSTGEEIVSRKPEESIDYLAFSGIHIIRSDIFKYLTAEKKYSITPEYLKLSAKHKIISFEHCEPVFDLGTPERIAEFEKYLSL